MSLLDFLPFRRRPRPTDASLPPSEAPFARRDNLPPVADLNRLHLLMLLFSRP
jgi:hypothetical protein